MTWGYRHSGRRQAPFPMTIKILFRTFFDCGNGIREGWTGLTLEDPKKTLEEKLPRTKSPRTGENAAAIAAKELKNKLAQDKVMHLNLLV